MSSSRPARSPHEGGQRFPIGSTEADDPSRLDRLGRRDDVRDRPPLDRAPGLPRRADHRRARPDAATRRLGRVLRRQPPRRHPASLLRRERPDPRGGDRRRPGRRERPVRDDGRRSLPGWPGGSAGSPSSPTGRTLPGAARAGRASDRRARLRQAQGDQDQPVRARRDAVFLRRAYLDAIGRLPEPARGPRIPGRPPTPTSGPSSSIGWSSAPSSPTSGP